MLWSFVDFNDFITWNANVGDADDVFRNLPLRIRQPCQWFLGRQSHATKECTFNRRDPAGHFDLFSLPATPNLPGFLVAFLSVGLLMAIGCNGASSATTPSGSANTSTTPTSTPIGTYQLEMIGTSGTDRTLMATTNLTLVVQEDIAPQSQSID
jgi:hypothetical protein